MTFCCKLEAVPGWKLPLLDVFRKSTVFLVRQFLRGFTTMLNCPSQTSLHIVTVACGWRFRWRPFKQLKSWKQIEWNEIFFKHAAITIFCEIPFLLKIIYNAVGDVSYQSPPRPLLLSDAGRLILKHKSYKINLLLFRLLDLTMAEGSSKLQLSAERWLVSVTAEMTFRWEVGWNFNDRL